MASVPSFRAGTGSANSATATSINTSIAAAVEPGDYLILVVSYKRFVGSDTLTTPSGWTVLCAPQDGSTGNTMQGAVYGKVATGSETSVTVSASGSQQLNTALAAYQLAGATPRSSNWVTGATSGVTTVPHTNPSPAAQSGDLIVCVAAIRTATGGGNPTYTGTGGVTVRAQGNNVSGSAENMGAYIGDANDVAGTKNVTASTSVYRISGQIVLVPGTTAVDRGTSESVSLDESLARQVSRSRAMAEAVDLSDAHARAIARARAAGETLTLVDAYGRAIDRPRGQAEGMTLGDAVGVSVVRARGTAEAVGLADGTARQAATLRALAESLGLTDALTRGATAYARGTAESVTLAHSFGQVQAQSRGTAEAVDLDDAVDAEVVRGRSVAESLTLADSVTRGAMPRARGTAEAIGLADGLTRSVGRPRGAAEALGLADGVERSAISRLLAVAETLSLVDAATRTLARGRGTAEAIALAAAFARQKAAPRGLAEAIGLASAVARTQAVALGVDEEMTLSEAVELILVKATSGTGAIALADANTRRVDAVRAQAETLGLANTIAVGRLVNVDVEETIGLADAFERAIERWRPAAEAMSMDAATHQDMASARYVGEAYSMTTEFAVGRVLLVDGEAAIGLDAGAVAPVASVRGIAEAIGLGNTVARLVDRSRARAESLTLTDAMVAMRLALVGVDESLTLDGVATRAAQSTGRSLAEAIALGDTFARQVDRARAVAEAIALADAFLAARQIIPVATAEELSFSASAANRVSRGRSITGQIDFESSASRRINRPRARNESITLGHVFAAVRGTLISAGSSMTLEDQVDRAVARAAAIAEALAIVDQFFTNFDPTDQPPIAYPHRIVMTSRPATIRNTSAGGGTVRRTV